MARVRGMGVAVMISWCGRRSFVSALFHQRHALVHAETVLFIHDHQAQAFEIDALLHQRMGADDHRGPGLRCPPGWRCAPCR